MQTAAFTPSIIRRALAGAARRTRPVLAAAILASAWPAPAHAILFKLVISNPGLSRILRTEVYARLDAANEAMGRAVATAGERPYCLRMEAPALGSITPRMRFRWNVEWQVPILFIRPVTAPGQEEGWRYAVGNALLLASDGADPSRIIQAAGIIMSYLPWEFGVDDHDDELAYFFSLTLQQVLEAFRYARMRERDEPMPGLVSFVPAGHLDAFMPSRSLILPTLPDPPAPPSPVAVSPVAPRAVAAAAPRTLMSLPRAVLVEAPVVVRRRGPFVLPPRPRVRHVFEELRRRGWVLARQRGSHRYFINPDLPDLGGFTVSEHRLDDIIHPRTLRSICQRAGLTTQ